MRRPRPVEVLDAVQWVTGYDPRARDRKRTTIAARRLACTALAQICDLSSLSIGQELDRDHSTVLHHLRIPVDYHDLRSVLERVDHEIKLSEAESWIA